MICSYSKKLSRRSFAFLFDKNPSESFRGGRVLLQNSVFYCLCLNTQKFGFDKLKEKQGGCGPPLKLKHKIPGYDYYDNFELCSEVDSAISSYFKQLS